MTQPIECVLAYSRKGLIRKGKDWVTDQERRKALPAKPVYVPVRGPYGEVARVAYQANALQERAGFIDFLFAPEPLTIEDEKEE